MYNLDSIIKIYFKNTTAKEVLEGSVAYNRYPENVFQNKALMFMKYYSDTENAGLYRYAKGDFYDYDYRNSGHSQPDVFWALAKLSENLLVMQESAVVCRYSEFVRWRKVTTDIDETNLICAFLAKRSAAGMERYRSFLWNNTIGHNNVQLNGILQKGIADNHFHLFGSAPIFELSWLNLMQNVYDIRMIKQLRKIDKRRRTSYTYNSAGNTKHSLECQHLQAVLLRAVLTMVLWQKYGIIKDIRILLEEYGYNDRTLNDILKSPGLIFDEKSKIQALVDDLKNIAACEVELGDYDYALYGPEYGGVETSLPNLIFSGDRWIIYEFLEGLYKEKSYNDTIYNWLYAYMLIKSDIRSEIIQTNDNIGFENFAVYSRRKSGFLYKKNVLKSMIENAVFTDKKNMKSLEIRVTPGKTAYENAAMISEYSKIIGTSHGRKPMSHEWFYFVFHFTKQPDTLPDKDSYFGESCRHYRKRISLEKQAAQLISFRNQYPELARKVRGIDACSQEIGCRPEVFAPVFRKLGQHVCDAGLECSVPQLKKTYHVGEDFLDIADGLRAVEECVRFLNLQCGDRIGHGTVLGIDVCSWYKTKRNTIIIPVQDYLDNVSWMYNKLTEFRVEGCDILGNYLYKEFDFYFSELYERNIRHHNQKQSRNNFNIHNYYDAWKLRGDDPRIYIDGRFSEEKCWEVGRYGIDSAHGENRHLRNSEECCLLYYYYHYSWEIRTQGAEMKEIYIPSFYVEGVEKLQKAMQRYIGEMGIGIETNPTSNYLISVMSGYEEHPILSLYNKNLGDIENERNCSQLFVSVNTDDKGIFRTSLENEFSFLAAALEGAKDSDGNKKYNRQMIYQWLDNIRQMGLQQSFLSDIQRD